MLIFELFFNKNNVLFLLKHLCMNLNIQLLMRVGIAGTFVGHGFFAIGVEPKWIHFLTSAGFSYEGAKEIMPFIGFMDFLIAIFAIFLPLRIILIWATIWAFATALIRPIVGLPIMAFIERSANWILPLSLLFLQGFPRRVSELFYVRSSEKTKINKKKIFNQKV